MAIQQIQHGHGATIYPSDTENISEYLQVYGRSTCLYVGTGGNLRVLTVGGDDVTFRNVQSGQFIPVMVTKVFLTGTTASNITVVDMGPGRFRGLLFDYSKRVSFDGGVVEAGACVDAVNNLLLNASLLLIPSGYKGGKLYSEIPTNGNGDLTWTRGGDAFRTNASGVLQRVPWNLLQQSETFSNATWTKNATTITADTIIAPNGTLTADKLVETATSSTHWVFQSTTYTSASQTVSCYMKKGERNFGFIRTRTATTDLFAWFNLNTGALGTVESGITASITNVGDGWYRCVVVNPNPTTSANPSVIGLSNADNVSTYTGDGTSGIYIWGAQLVEGTTAQTYLPTTDRLNFPRLSYMYGSCPSALLEPQRTNLVVWSDDFSNAVWTKSASSVTANTSTSPDGSTNADTFTADGTTALHRLGVGLSITTGTNYTLSIYAKKNTNNFIQIVGGFDAFGSNVWANFDLNSGVVGSVGSSTTASIVNVGSGWYRCIVTGLSTATTTVLPYQVVMISSSTSARAESNNLSTSVFIYGAQLEQGAYTTTYIPTTSATATRVADSFSRNNIYTNGLISASGGTWFVELRNNVSYVRDASTRIGVGDDSTLLTNSLFLNPVFGGGRIYIQKCVSGSIIGLYQTTTNTCKIAIKWNGTSADIFENGVKVVSATSFTTTNMEWLTGNAGTPVFIQQMALFPTLLSDTDCQLLTAL